MNVDKRAYAASAFIRRWLEVVYLQVNKNFTASATQSKVSATHSTSPSPTTAAPTTSSSTTSTTKITSKSIHFISKIGYLLKPEFCTRGRGGKNTKSPTALGLNPIETAYEASKSYLL